MISNLYGPWDSGSHNKLINELSCSLYSFKLHMWHKMIAVKCHMSSLCERVPSAIKWAFCCHFCLLCILLIIFHFLKNVRPWAWEGAGYQRPHPVRLPLNEHSRSAIRKIAVSQQTLKIGFPYPKRLGHAADYSLLEVFRYVHYYPYPLLALERFLTVRILLRKLGLSLNGLFAS